MPEIQTSFCALFPMVPLRRRGKIFWGSIFAVFSWPLVQATQNVGVQKVQHKGLLHSVAWIANPASNRCELLQVDEGHGLVSNLMLHL